MLRIERHYNRYKVSASERTPGVRSWSVTADSLESVCLAVRHYFAPHLDESHDKEKCPLCREEAA